MEELLVWHTRDTVFMVGWYFMSFVAHSVYHRFKRMSIAKAFVFYHTEPIYIMLGILNSAAAFVADIIKGEWM